MIYKLLVLSALVFGLSLVMVTLGLVVSKKSMNSMTKISPFECGFSSYLNARLPFSNQFFLIAIFFLVFDVELMIMFPYILMNNMNILSMISYSMFMMFLLLVTIGLMYEWNQKKLEWSKF